MKKEELKEGDILKECDIYIKKTLYNRIERDSRALSISMNSLISWMLFRGCIDLQRNKSMLNGYNQEEKGEKRIHCRISEKIHTCLKKFCEKRYHTEFIKLVPMIIQMESDKMNKYDMMREPETMAKKSYKEMRLKLNVDVADKKEITNLLNQILSGDKKLRREINIKVNCSFLNQLNDISEFTGIKLSDLIPLMLCEYLMILSKARYELPKEYQ